ncbi:hypothetical protein P7C73_g6842, partial [Tremellales sp. Uapishka_1]
MPPSLHLPFALPAPPSDLPRSRSGSLSVARSPSIHSTGPLDAPHAFKSIPNRVLSDISSGDETSPDRGGERPRQVTFDPVPRIEEFERYDVESVPVSLSGFQSPDSKELLGILISFVAVGLLAGAACLTTLYDWVL